MSYTYKHICSIIPQHIIQQFVQERGREPDKDPNYNGDYWTLVKMWIEDLQNQNEANYFAGFNDGYNDATEFYERDIY